MATTAAKAFDEFHDRIRPTEKQDATIRSRRDAVVKFLAGYFDQRSDMPLQDVRVIGSAARGTIIRPLDDIDVLVVFDDSKVWPGYRNDSQKLMRRVRGALDKYNVQVVGARGQAVRLFYSEPPHTDITPVFPYDRGGYVLPQGDGGWIRTDPDSNDAYLTDRNQALSGNLKSFTRMLKQWNRAHSARLKGFHLEVMAAKTFKTLGRNSREAFEVFFKHAPKVLHVNDPAGFSGDLASRLTRKQEADVVNSFETANDRAASAREAESRGDQQEAIRLWRIVFGEIFPAFG